MASDHAPASDSGSSRRLRTCAVASLSTLSPPRWPDCFRPTWSASQMIGSRAGMFHRLIPYWPPVTEIDLPRQPLPDATDRTGGAWFLRGPRIPRPSRHIQCPSGVRVEQTDVQVGIRAQARSRSRLTPSTSGSGWRTPKNPTPSVAPTAGPWSLLGLCDHWRAPDGHWLASATIITTSDNSDMHEIHDRMPVILESDVLDRWLDPALDDRHELEAMLRPSPARTLEHYPVSRDVGNVRNNSAQFCWTTPSASLL